SSHRVTAFSQRRFSQRLFLWNLHSDISKPIEGYREKENIFH
ncbi:putative nef attachable protein, partial [Chlamydia psittaci C1/97]